MSPAFHDSIYNIVVPLSRPFGESTIDYKNAPIVKLLAVPLLSEVHTFNLLLKL